MSHSLNRVAVVLYNLGGPQAWQDTRAFLYNLFTDPYIIRVPSPFRQMLASLISRLRYKKVEKIYQALGGGSPLYANSVEQAAALQEALQAQGAATTGAETKVFLAMRCWHPLISDILQEVKDFAPDQVLLVPLYPQFSTTTTESFQAEWQRLWRGSSVPVKSICCYPTLRGWVQHMARGVDEALQAAPRDVPVRVLFSAHGLPQKIVDQGDPYPEHVRQSVEAIVANLKSPNVQWRISYQSRVGPMKWLEPSTETEIRQAGEERVGLVVVPVAFVSEHSETLFELDREYHEIATEHHVPYWARVATAGAAPIFINDLAGRILDVLEGRSDRCGDVGGCRPRCKWESQNARVA